MAIMTIAGDAFNVLVEGDETKPALMISNPLATNLRFWDRQMPAFLEHFRVVRYDSRGHGESVTDEGPYSIDGLGRDALAILDRLGIEKAHWLGLSKGGMVGLWVLAHAPERISRAVLANTAAQVPGPNLWNSRIQSARKTGMDGVADVIAERWFTKSFRDSHADEVESVVAMVRSTPLQGYIATCSALRDMDLREAIRKIQIPVLVITGRYDPSTPPEMGAFVASTINGAKLVTLEASHISNVEASADFTEAVVDFLTRAEPLETGAPPRRRAAAKKPTVTKAAPKSPEKKAPAKTAPVKQTPGAKAAAKSAAGPKSRAEVAAAIEKGPAKKAATKKLAGKGALAKQAPIKQKASPKPTKKVAAEKTSATTGKSPVQKVMAQKPAGRKR